MTALPKTSKPAERAIVEAGYATLEDLAGVDPDLLLGLHGVGPRAIPILEAALSEHGLAPLRARAPRRSVGGDSG
ncbi:MAG: hypothetical protein ABWY56_12340 [Propionibacteriaceae bacterium]